MCGITGYIGTKNAIEIALDALKRLEYRGYDSAGLAYPLNGEVKVVKLAGKISGLYNASKGLHSNIAITHTRWATHGSPNTVNAHPHTSTDKTVAVVHNGIIENYLSLKHELQEEGFVFLSETDTEVIAHLLSREWIKHGGELTDAVRKATNLLRGSYAIAVVSSETPNEIVVARKDSPLVLGIGEGENFIASDIPALLPYTRKVIILRDGDIAQITKDKITITENSGAEINRQPMIVDWNIDAAEKGGYDHFMIKEIHEQPQAIRETLRGRLKDDDTVEFPDLKWNRETWESFKRIIIIACGTAYHAGLVGKFVFEKLLRRPVEVFFASEFRYGDPLLDKSTLAVVISQSGETADTLAALRMCQAAGVKTLGVVNVVGSSIARECEQVAYTQAGPEICVASTKAYSAQVTMMYLLALHVARIQMFGNEENLKSIGRELRALPEKVTEALECEEQIKLIAKAVKDAPTMFYLGRGVDAHVALEGALKIKEIAYVPTQETPAGEMKHGPLALIEPGVSSVFIATQVHTREKILSNIKEIKARSGTVIILMRKGDELLKEEADYAIELPPTDPDYLSAPLAVLPMQLLAYYVACERACDIDQPRNLAKSVTVE